jgi:phytol kinase
MHSPFFSLLIFLFLLLALIVITESLHRYFKFTAEQSRKFLHVSGGLMCLLFPRFFNSHWWVLVLAVVSFLLLFITYRKKMLPSIHQTRRPSIGSVLFPIPVYICFLIAEINQNELFFYLPVSLLTLADTAAEIGGNKWGHLTRKFFNGQKTLAGSLCFAITAMAICFVWLILVYHYPLEVFIKTGLIISLLTALAELVTLHGWDNLTIPAVALVILQAFM